MSYPVDQAHCITQLADAEASLKSIAATGKASRKFVAEAREYAAWITERLDEIVVTADGAEFVDAR